MFNKNITERLQDIDTKVEDLYNQITLARMSVRNQETAQCISDWECNIDSLLAEKSRLENMQKLRMCSKVH